MHTPPSRQPMMPRRALIAAMMLATTMLAAMLDACHHRAAPPEPAIAVTDGRLVLSPLKGRPAAAYFTIINRQPKDIVLDRVTIEGAGMTMMHETKGVSMEPLAQVVVPAHGSLSFAPGARHVMVFDVAARVMPGGIAPAMLHFVGGTSLTVGLRVEIIGGRGAGKSTSGAMPGMKMSGMKM